MSDAIEVLNRTRKVLNTNPVIKAHLDSYCFYLENEGRGKTEAREEVFDFVNELESEFDKALLALEQKEKLKDIQDYLATIIFNIEDLNYSDDDDIVGDLKKLNSKLKEVLERVGGQK